MLRSMRSRLFHSPLLHSPGPGKERKVGWLVPIWFTWTGTTFYANRFVVDDVLHRGLVFFQMVAVGAMAIFVPAVIEGETRSFALAYAGARFVLALLYARAWLQGHLAEEMTRRTTLGTTVGASIWLASAFVPSPWVYLVWAVAMVLDFSVPLNKQTRALAGRYPPDVLHMSERYGLLIIIVLGESFVKVLTYLADHGAPASGLTLGALTLVVTCCLWWIYFDDVAGSRIKATPTAGFVWVYAHLPLTIAVTACGVAMKKAVAFDPFEPAYGKYRWLLCGTLALALLFVSVIDHVTERRQSEMSDRARTTVRLSCATLVLLLAVAGAAMPAWAFLAAVAAICVAQVVFDLSMAPLAPYEHAHHEDAHRDGLFGAHTEERDEDDERPKPNRMLATNAVRKGAPSELRRDLYFHLMAGGWLRVFGTLAALFVATNVFFAVLYMLDDPGGVAQMEPGSFLDAFSFSVQTMATIGYGTMSPVSAYSNKIMILEAAVSILAVALATGLMFAKASRPSASVLFTEKVVVTEHDGQPTLMFRVGNARGNEIVEATMRMTAVIDVPEPHGPGFNRRLFDMKLVRDNSPIFSLTWNLYHRLDEDSPLHGITAENIGERLAVLVCAMTGYDSTYAQSTHARNMYFPEDFRFGHRLSDIVSMLDDGRLLIDYDRFHYTVPAEVSEDQKPSSDNS